ncbi:hypothetical protein BJ875DRAFT_498075 [Amylocarpus encephaloides]|uniref:Uncharacterized protein n=1 Tax=Amylocarpus encephaloides TaxID=45428 RepID=A0A9P8C2P2_9HELO|nr:hypothetical protein BJ875DRAFT_498075 [Amylocarpus encephaloides]
MDSRFANDANDGAYDANIQQRQAEFHEIASDQARNKQELAQRKASFDAFIHNLETQGLVSAEKAAELREKSDKDIMQERNRRAGVSRQKLQATDDRFEKTTKGIKTQGIALLISDLKNLTHYSAPGAFPPVNNSQILQEHLGQPSRSEKLVPLPRAADLPPASSSPSSSNQRHKKQRKRRRHQAKAEREVFPQHADSGDAKSPASHPSWYADKQNRVGINSPDGILRKGLGLRWKDFNALRGHIKEQVAARKDLTMDLGEKRIFAFVYSTELVEKYSEERFFFSRVPNADWARAAVEVLIQRVLGHEFILSGAQYQDEGCPMAKDNSPQWALRYDNGSFWSSSLAVGMDNCWHGDLVIKPHHAQVIVYKPAESMVYIALDSKKPGGKSEVWFKFDTEVTLDRFLVILAKGCPKQELVNNDQLNF